MALWKETSSTPSPAASSTPAAASGPTSVTELHGKVERPPVEAHPAVEAAKRAAPRPPPCHAELWDAFLSCHAELCVPFASC